MMRRHPVVLKIVVLALVLVAGALTANAQPRPAEHVSPAGIRFLHIALHDDTHHSLALGWIDGATYAEPGKERLPQVSARLIMEGSRTLNESGRIEKLRDLQSSIGISADRTQARALITAPPGQFVEVAALFADMVRNPALPERKLLLARRNAQITWPQAREQAETLAAHVFLRLLLGDGPALKAALGDPAAESAIGVRDVDEWRQAVLARQPAAVVSAGPVPAETVARELDRIFAGFATPAGTRAAKPALRALGKLVVLEHPTVQTAIVAGGPTGWVTDTNAFVGRLAVRVLGGGFNSRLTKAVREGLGATYGIRASLQQIHPEAFALNIATQVDSTKAAATLEAVRREYARLREGGVAGEEVEPLKTRLVTEMREQFRRSSGAAQSLRDIVLVGLPAAYAATFAERVQAISADSVSAGIRERMPAPPLTIVMVAPSAEGLGADCVIKSPEEVGTCE